MKHWLCVPSGVFFECLPDDEDRCADPTIRQQNAARLRFYEQYGARPIVGTAYESPVPHGDVDNLPHLVWDDLDTGKPLRAELAREVAKAVLERKYRDLCPPAYVRKVIASFRDDPVKIREPRYVTASVDHKTAAALKPEPIAMAINDKHDIHHIRERGYVESPVRIKAITGELENSGMVQAITVKEYPLKHILAVHDADFVNYLRVACSKAPLGKSVYPYVFPIRNATRPPKEMTVRAGYYCIDTFTPINRNAFPAAKRAVDCVLTAADEILDGRRIAYALVRPPGHHAERRSFGGFCYFSNSAVGAQYLSGYGRVAIVDIDYHHGNGQQDIFYERSDVLTVSIHGDPDFAYPYFTGFADERGAGPAQDSISTSCCPNVRTEHNIAGRWPRQSTRFATSNRRFCSLPSDWTLPKVIPRALGHLGQRTLPPTERCWDLCSCRHWSFRRVVTARERWARMRRVSSKV